MSTPTVEFRAATTADVPAILGLVRELAEYERAAHEVVATEAHYEAVLFGPDRFVECDVAVVDGDIVGMAMWFRRFSTWTGTPCMYLEDLYVQPAHRRFGIGREFLARLARHCVTEGWARFEWSVLDWNEPARAFYRSLGAESLDEWVLNRLSGEALGTLGVHRSGA